MNEMVKKGLVPSVVTYNALIGGLCREERFDDVFRLLEKMEMQGPEPDCWTYTQLVDGLCKHGEVERGAKMLHEALGKGFAPGVVTYNALVNGYCKSGDVKTALDVLQLMERNRVNPDVQTFNEVINGFCCSGKVHRAMALLTQMIGAGLSPNTVTFNSLISGQCIVGNMKNAFRLLDLMEEYGVLPDQQTYAIIIDALCDKGRVEDANCLFTCLFEKGIKAHTLIYNSLIRGYCQVGNIDSAFGLMERMHSEDCLPDVYTYNALINGMCKQERLADAMDLLDKMKKQGIEPTTCTFNILMKQMLCEEKPVDAAKMYEQMISSGCKADKYTYTLKISTNYFEVASTEDQGITTIKMREAGVSPDVVTYNALIKAYSDAGLMEKVFSAHAEMLCVPLDPDCATYSILLKHIYNKDDNEAVDDDKIWKTVDVRSLQELFKLMCKYDPAPGISTYKALLKGLCNQCRLEEVEWLLQKMQESSIRLDEDMSDYLLVCYCNLKMYIEACKLFRSMTHSSYQPGLKSCCLLLSCLCDSGDHGTALSIFSDILGMGYNYDEIVWTLLIDCPHEKVHAGACLEMLSMMKDRTCFISTRTYTSLVNLVGGN